MALATLSIDLVAKLSKFEGDLGKAARASEQTAARMNAAFGTVKATLAGVAAGVSIAGIVSFAKATIDGIDALNDLKDATGASIENISALEDVAKRTGTSFDTVGTSLVKFNAALKEAKPGSDAEAALKAIGLSATELKKIDPAEALLQTATALAGFADDGNKARLTQELFGKSLKEVAPFLKDLADSGQLNATVTTAQAEKAEEFNKQLFALKKNAEDAARTITSDLVPALNNILKAYTTSGIKAAADQFGEAVFGWTSNQQEKRIKNLTGDIADLRKEFTGAGSFASQTKIGSQIDAKVEELTRLKAQYFKLTDGSVGGGRGTFIKSNVDNRDALDFTGAPKKKGGTASKAEQVDEARRSLAQYVEGLSKSLEVSQQLTETEKALNFLRTQGVQGQIPQVRELVLGLAEQVDKEKELGALLKANRDAASAAGDAINARNEKYQATLAGLLAATPTALLEKQREDVQLLTEELEAGRLSETLYLEAVTARLNLTGEKLQETKSIAQDLGLTFTSSFEDAILAGKDLQGVLNAISQDIGKLILRKTITEPAGNYLSGLVTSSLGSLFSFDGGGYTGTGARSGGADGKGGFLAMLHPNETVVDHARGQGGSSNVTYIFNGGVSRGEVMAGLQQVRAAAVGDVVDGRARRRF